MALYRADKPDYSYLRGTTPEQVFAGTYFQPTYGDRDGGGRSA